MPLSDTYLRRLKAGDKPKHADGGGLYLFLSPVGGMLWRMDYRFEGKRKTLSFGAYPAVTLKDARARREEAKEQLAAGIDPAAEKKRVKVQAAIEEKAAALTFEAVARDWFNKKRTAWTEGHQRKILSRLENQLFPHIGGRQVSDLEVGDYLAAVQKAEARGAIETAHRLAQLCGQVTRFARITGIVRHDAAAGLVEALAHVQTTHYAAITSPAELGYLLRAIDAYQGEPSICHALRVLPYVFVRSGELRGMTWEEVNLDAGEWIIPAGRMKMRRPHVVPLARQVVRLLQSMGLLNALRRMGYGKEQMTVHGFRTTASTLLNEQGYRPDWIEAQLAHAERNAIRDAYNRAEYLPERRKMMQEWADYLDSLRTGA